jgi:hypothetical protein
MCPQCFDSMLQPVEGVELLALHTSEFRIVSPIALYRCTNWHIFAIFSANCHP